MFTNRLNSRSQRSYKALKKEINKGKNKNAKDVKISISKILLNRQLDRGHNLKIKKSKSMQRFFQRKSYELPESRTREESKPLILKSNDEGSIFESDFHLDQDLKACISKKFDVDVNFNGYSQNFPRNHSYDTMKSEKNMIKIENKLRFEIKEMISEEMSKIKNDLNKNFYDDLNSLKTEIKNYNEKFTNFENFENKIEKYNKHKKTDYKKIKNEIISIKEKLSLIKENDKKEPKKNNKIVNKQLENINKISKSNSLKILRSNLDLKNIEKKVNLDKENLENVILRVKNKVDEFIYEFSNKNTLIKDSYFTKVMKKLDEKFSGLGEKLDTMIKKLYDRVDLLDNKIGIFKVAAKNYNPNFSNNIFKINNSNIVDSKNNKLSNKSNGSFNRKFLSAFKPKSCFYSDCDNKKNSEKISSQKNIDKEKIFNKRNFENLMSIFDKDDRDDKNDKEHKLKKPVEKIDDFQNKKNCYQISENDKFNQNQISLIVNESGHVVYKNGNYVRDEYNQPLILSEGQIEYLKKNENIEDGIKK